MDSQTSQTIQQPAVALPKLSPFWPMLNSSLTDFGQNFWKYLGIVALPFLFMIPIGIGMVIGAFYVTDWKSLDISLLIILGIIGLALIVSAIIAGLFSQVALLLAIKSPEKKIKELLLEAKPLIGKFFGTSLLTGITIMFLFLLLIVPGIIFSVYYCLVSYVFIYEGRINSDAMSRSKILVKGHWWPIAWRLLGLGIIFIVVSIILNQIDKSAFGSDSAVFSNITQLLFTPLSAIFLTKLYHELKSIKG